MHIPFCDSKCHYCSFNSFTNQHHRIEAYIKALHKSLKNKIIKENIKRGELKTLFIGGGTPSTISPKLYEVIFNTLMPYLAKDAEITTEANPNSATKEWLEGMYNLGVNRVSFGVQSFNNNKLIMLNRAHSAKEAIDAVENAAKIGFKDISIDIIYDLNSDTKELLQNDLNLAFALPINHISCYELTIERATQFFKEPSVKQNNEELGYFIQEIATNNGYKQYEVSNYGKMHSRHNLGYWQYKDYLGIGAGAVGFKKDTRYYPHANIEQFIKEPTFEQKEHLTPKDILTEKILLGLRSIVGIDASLLTKQMQERANILIKEQKLYLKDGRYYNREFFISDALALFIIDD